MRTVTIVDSTLRDGAQAAGVCLDSSDRLAIAEALHDLGVVEMEIGIPAMGEQERHIIRRVANALPTVEWATWCRARESDIVAASDCNCSTVHISFPLSDIHLSALGKSESWLFEQLQSLTLIAHGFFPRFTVGCQDASRAPADRLCRFIDEAHVRGATRVRIADTVGILGPRQTAALIGSILDKTPHARLEFHGHNDLGMATANALTALEAGAEAVSVTVNGMGERAGNAALEEVAMAITCCAPTLNTTVDSTKIQATCALVARLAQRSISPWKPVVGSDVFTHSAGIHCHGLRIDQRTYEPFNPAAVGHAPSQMVAGTHSGSAGIQAMLAAEGIAVSRDQAREIARKAARQAEHQKHALTPRQVRFLADQEVAYAHNT